MVSWTHRFASQSELFCFLLVVGSGVTVVVDALTVPQPSQSHPFIELTNPLKLSSASDRLPVGLVSDWPTWVLQLRRLNEEEEGITPTTNGNSSSHRWTQIPSPQQQQRQKTDISGNSGGFVNPVSIDALWQAADLRAPECRLAVGLHVRHGVLRHVLPALDLSYSSNNHHRNRGLCTVPRAHQWMDFGAYMAGFGKHSLRLQTRRNTGTDDDEEEEWQTLLQLDSIADTVNKAITALAEEPPTALGDGSCIVHVVWAESADMIECPTTSGSEIRVLLSEHDDDDDGAVVGTLHVRVETTAAGSESEYLPEAYKPLFKDVSLRRAAYTEAKRRLQEQKTANTYQ